MNKNILQAIIILIAGLLSISSSCHSFYNCSSDDNNLPCDMLFTTSPRNNPIYYNNYANSLLFSNGELLVFKKSIWFENDFVSYSLQDICVADSICEIYYYNYRLMYDIYDDHLYHYLENDTCIYVVSPNKIIRLDYQYNAMGTIGNEGDSAVILHNAIAGAINCQGEIFALDDFDHRVKRYEYGGALLNSWYIDGLPVKIALLDDTLFVLNAGNNSIEKYDYEGNFAGYALQPGILTDPVAFNIFERNKFWISDLKGTRVRELSSSGKCDKCFDSFCFYDISFNFRNVLFISGDVAIFGLIDTENDYLISADFVEGN